MARRDKCRKKNPVGFTERQLKILLNYCHFARKDPKVHISRIQKVFTSYARRKSVSDMIHKAYEKKVISGPFLFTNCGIEVSLINDVDNPTEFFENCKKDKKTTLVVVSHGYWPIFLCKIGANTLQYHESILPFNGRISEKKIEKIFYEQKDELPIDPFPHGWFEKHWEVYYCFRSPRLMTFRKAGEILKMDWSSVRDYYIEILNQCKVITTFFPLGREAYSPLLVTFKTLYENGIVNGLKTLNRTTYLYKTDNTLILLIGIGTVPREQNLITKKFQRLEEMGLISDLHISTPYDWNQLF